MADAITDVAALPTDRPAPAAPLARARRRLPARSLSSLRRLVGLALPLAAWEINAQVNPDRLTPTFGQIFEELRIAVETGDLWYHGQATLTRGLTGLAIAIVIGVAVGFLMARSRVVSAMLEPTLNAAFAVPKLAFFPIVLLLLGPEGPVLVVMVAVECAFPIIVNVHAAGASMDRRFLALARNAGASRRRVLTDIFVPATLPAVLTGVRIAAPVMLVVLTILELFNGGQGLGGMLLNAQATFNTPGVLAIVLVLGVAGLLLDRLLALVTRRAVYWEREAFL